jgi:hypothetical protein
LFSAHTNMKPNKGRRLNRSNSNPRGGITK